MANSWQTVSTLAEERHGVVALREIIGAGLSRRAVEHLVANGRLTMIGPGVWRVSGAPDSLPAQALGAILGIDGDAWASHRTAAALWGVKVHGPAATIDITRLYGSSASRGGIHIHRSTFVPPHHVTVLGGVPITTVPRTLFDLARRTGPKVLDRAVEDALRHHRCTIGSLHRVLAELGGRGRPGTVKMRSALESRDADYVPTSSELTAVGRAVLASIAGIEWEVPISDEQGYIRQVDGYVRRAGVVIEFDGASFHSQPSDIRSDADQDARLVAMGNVVERLTWIDVTRRPDSTVAKVLRLIEGGAA